MTDEQNTSLSYAKWLVKYLRCNNLPKELIDDKRLRIDWEARTDDETLLAHFNEDSLSGIKTVRFLKDFFNYQAGYDRETRNTSFLRTTEVFRQQGINNFYFILQLNNPLLKGVDPFDPNLTPEQQVWVLEECRSNFWYFLREVCRLKPNQPFLANRGNISFIWSYLNHITTYMIMPRQQGKQQRNSAKVRIVPKDTLKTITPQDTWKRIEHLRVGDQVLDRSGKPCQVIGIHPQGKRRLYRVITSDGRATDVGTEHLWTLKDYSNCLNGRALWNDYSTVDVINLLKKKVKLQLPLPAPVPGSEQDLPIDPYVLGLIYCGQDQDGKVIIPTRTDAVKQYVVDHLPRGVTVIQGVANSCLERTDNQPYLFNREHGLPDQYLEAPLNARRDLLQAFLDVRGKVGRGKVFIALNRVLGGQLAYLARSLGGTGKVTKNGVEITLPEEVPPFKFREENVVFDNRLLIERVTFVGDDDCTCIEVDNSEQLYLTDDFIVTHNTVSVQVIDFWLTYIMGRGYTSHLITLKSDNRAQFIAAIKQIRSSIPSYLINSTYKDKDAGTSLTYKAFGEDNVNTLYINVPQISQDAAGDLGRGLRVGTTNYDESGYIRFIDTIIDGCSPSSLTEMALCREQGLPYGITHITTPNTTLHPSGEFMFNKLMSATEWREKFFDCFSESHLRQMLLRASPTKTTSPSVSMVYNYLQLGKDKAWVRETIDLLGLSLAKAKIDLLLMWVEDGENRLFDDVTREAINNMKRDVVWSKEYRDCNLYVDFFVTQQELLEMAKKEYNDHFLIGVDTSSAINKDACTIVIRSMKTGKVIGVGRYPLTFLDDVTAIVVDLLDVIQNSTLIIERNYAHHMIDSLLIMLPAKGMDPFKRVFNQIYQDTVNNAKEFEEVQNTKFAYRNKAFYLKYKQYFGFVTTKTSRDVLYGLIQEAVGNTGYGLCYAKLADELINLKLKGDRIDHDAKQHDDLVIAWLLSYWFIKLGENKSLYGIPPGIALTDTRNLLNSAQNQGRTEYEPYVVQLIDKVRSKVHSLTEELMSTQDNILALRLEVEIRKLAKMLPPEQNRMMTIDVLLENAKVERNKRLLQQRRTA